MQCSPRPMTHPYSLQHKYMSVIYRGGKRHCTCTIFTTCFNPEEEENICLPFISLHLLLSLTFRPEVDMAINAPASLFPNYLNKHPSHAGPSLPSFLVVFFFFCGNQRHCQQPFSHLSPMSWSL